MLYYPYQLPSISKHPVENQSGELKRWVALRFHCYHNSMVYKTSVLITVLCCSWICYHTLSCVNINSMLRMFIEYQSFLQNLETVVNSACAQVFTELLLLGDFNYRGIAWCRLQTYQSIAEIISLSSDLLLINISLTNHKSVPNLGFTLYII